MTLVVVFLYSESFCVEVLITAVVRGQLLFNSNRDNYACIEMFKTLAVILDPPI